MKMKKIEAIIRPERLDVVKKALVDKGFVAMTVSEVLGRGEQKGIKFQYRRGTLGVDLLPKLKIEMYITDKSADSMMKIICDAARTSKFGDGRIFVTPVEKSGRVRTEDVDICDSDIKGTAATGEPFEAKETPLLKT